MFMMFMTIQEINDTSYNHLLIMRAKYTDKALICGAIGAHITSNLLVVVTFWLMFSCFSPRSTKMFGCLLVYFIVGYELIFNAVKNVSVFMEFHNTNTLQN
jgi:putative Ca2+/H+ antiporter (TMEM165/GDT1 family)